MESKTALEVAGPFFLCANIQQLGKRLKQSAGLSVIVIGCSQWAAEVTATATFLDSFHSAMYGCRSRIIF